MKKLPGGFPQLTATAVTPMWCRPVRQATAHSLPADGEMSKVLVHRNELNEQQRQRPGSLILFPQTFRKGTSLGTVTRWMPKLVREMLLNQEGNTSGILCDSLLLYSGDYIRLNNLDTRGKIPDALLKKNVLFATNHIDVSSGAGMVSSMRGVPVITHVPAPASPRACTRTRWQIALCAAGLCTHKHTHTCTRAAHTHTHAHTHARSYYWAGICQCGASPRAQDGRSCGHSVRATSDRGLVLE
jgi:hypothetical protein